MMEYGAGAIFQWLRFGFTRNRIARSDESYEPQGSTVRKPVQVLRKHSSLLLVGFMSISTQKLTETELERPWALRLFVAKHNAPSATAIVQLNRIVDQYLPPNSTMEIIDALEDPEAAEREQIIAIPTLIRKRPMPVRRVVGDLSDIAKVLTMLGFFNHS
jgi:circadian clock protein KaiB